MHTRNEPTLSLENAPPGPQPDPLAAALQTPPAPSRALKFWTYAIYVGLWALAVLLRDDTPSTAKAASTLGQAVGAAVALAIPPCLVILILSVFKPLRTPRNRMRIAFGVGLALLGMLATLSGMAFYQGKQKAIAYTEIRHVGDVMRTAMYAADHPQGDVPDIDPAPKARGAYGQIERAVKILLGQRLTQYRAYMKELDDVRLSELFIANRLARDRGLVESRLILEQSQRIVQKYSQQNQRLLADVPLMIRSLDLSEQQKNQMVEGALKARPAQKATLARNWDIERQTLAEFEKMINLLDDNRRSWRAEHNEIVFDQDKLLARFQAHQQTVRQLTEERVRLELQQFDSLTSDLR